MVNCTDASLVTVMLTWKPLPCTSGGSRGLIAILKAVVPKDALTEGLESKEMVVLFPAESAGKRAGDAS